MSVSAGQPTPEQLGEINTLIKKNLLLQAWEKAKSHASLCDWQGGEAARIAASLASRIGAYQGSEYHGYSQF